ncbi:MAG: glycosyltransferase family 4 protein [Meiothermus sp.]|nr:glycosyltransferase family 4 protein [Meiothermus sp.]
MKLFFPISEQRTAASEQVYRLMYVGRMIALKGLPEFLQTLKKWAEDHPQRSLEFAMVGDGPLRAEIEAANWPANLKIVCHGHIPFHKVAEIYLTADLSVFPTLSEEWGCAVNEALATGLPMLGSVYSQGVEELIKDDVNGWQMRPDDLAATYKVLDKALNSSKAARERMIQAAKRTVEPLTEEYIADLIEGAVYTVLNEGTRKIEAGKGG